ncbi:MAG: TonB-dependent receptor [Burkholderiaceae bacterium]|nr:TonB-dependent receptor [Burkholderiaceae bacterium]
MALSLSALPLLPAQAQTQTPAPAATSVLITGSPLRGDSLNPPAQVLAGEGLALRRAGTLGETLAGLPGVAASGFGPQSSRPVIRGLDGDRIRLLDNGAGAPDASNLSFDHAVAIDPLVIERLEVLRGPTALLYGGNATGGVVNAIDNRIPRRPLGPLSGRLELRAGGAASERAGAAVLEAGSPGSGLSWHVDLAERRSRDLRTPAFTPPAEEHDHEHEDHAAEADAASPVRRVANSAGRSRAGALGLSWADHDGFVGVSVDQLRNNYGVVVDPEVSIRLKRERLALAGERRGLAGPLASLSFQASHTRYQHEEVEGTGEVGTTFRSRGQELRLLARQAATTLGGWRLDGAAGLQAERLDFSALGEEAFVPGTQTRSQALFLLQELSRPGSEGTGGDIGFSAGLRSERVRVASDGDAPEADEARFGVDASRRFTPFSAMLGAALPLGRSAGGAWRLRGTLGHTERAPAYYELYANGLHVATGVFEVGDAQQALERSRHAELGLQWQHAASRTQLQASLWHTRFANYIALDATGRDVTVEDHHTGGSTTVPEYRFNGVPARLQGLELEARTAGRGLPGLAGLAAWDWTASASLDWLRGDNLASGEPLPRLAPWRLALALEARRGDWQWALALRHQGEQNRVPATDRATPAATVADLALGYRQALGRSGGSGEPAEALWTLKLSNLGNALAYNASAVLPARERSPTGARALTAGLRLTF